MILPTFRIEYTLYIKITVCLTIFIIKIDSNIIYFNYIFNMAYKYLQQILPIEIINIIGEFDNTSKEHMNNVIKELKEYNDKVYEYESAQYYESVFGYDREINSKFKKSWEMESPYLLSRSKWRF